MLRIVHVEDNDERLLLGGSLGSHLQTLERQLGVRIESCDEGFRIEGEEAAVHQAEGVLRSLQQFRHQGLMPDQQNVRYLADQVVLGGDQALASFSPDVVCLSAKGQAIRAKTAGQSRYVRAIREHEICFGIGPAGTGKTFLAVALAVDAFRKKEVERIVLTRPAVEAGEKLGFLPGDLQSKVDPYMRPLYDALFTLMGAESYMKNMEKGLIEVSPLAYMRGRTLDASFIILDEAQNTTMEQMKMFLTRLGQGSKAVITGDVTQVDLPSGTRSALKGIRPILRKVEGLCFIDLDRTDVVRNGIVQRIIQAYEQHEKGGKQRG